MLEKVVAHVKTAGRQEAFADFTARRKPFFDRDLYVVCVDAHLVVVAHGGFATYVGSSGFFKDMNGKLVPPSIWQVGTKGGATGGTLRYTIKDDETNNLVEHKIGFFRRVGQDVCGVIAHDT